MAKMISRKFIIRKAFLGKGITVILSDIDGNKIEYDHDLVFKNNEEFFKKQQSFEKLGYFMNNGIPDEVNL